jgi:imidazolonepropionase-like amidohydrolase
VLLTRFDAAALVPVLTGRQLLLVHVERASDILQVLGLKREFPQLRLVLVGATEGWTVAREIAAAGVPVIANALEDLPSSFEQLAATQSNVGRMRRAGVKLGIGMLGDNEGHQVRLSTQYAGNLVALGKVPGATGLSWGEALAAITSGPAEALGMGGEIGSLRAGRRADVVIWDGDPLNTSSLPQMVMIDGVQQSLENRQTKLRDRYINPTEGSLPNAYDRR